MSARGWTRHTGRAAALPMEAVDTDQLIPARFMSTPRAEGYGRYLLHDLRFCDGCVPRPEFALNRVENAGATILVTGRNFGSGSSREAAVYALMDFGIRAVVAPSFGDIFAANAVNNGLCPVQVRPEDGAAMLRGLERGARQMTVDLEACALRGPLGTVGFTLDPVWRRKLIEGLDDIDLTRAYGAEIAAFRAADAAARPWAALDMTEKTTGRGRPERSA